jgi:hypothetical protein
MVSLNQDDVEAGLKRKGFLQSNNKHKYYHLYVNGKKEAGTYVSHGKNQEVGPRLLGPMAKELGISIKDFVDLVKCPLSTDEYLSKRMKRSLEGIRVMKR